MANIDKTRKNILSLEKGGKPKRGKLNVILFYPNSYNIAITSLAFHRIYEIVGSVNETGIFRYFLDGTNDKRLLPLDRDVNLSEADIIAFFLSYEMDFFNLVKSLRLLKIPLFAEERKNKYPLIIGGGVAVTENPETVADFFDLLFIGEAEESLPAFIELFFKEEKREDILEKASYIKGVYNPEKVSFEYGNSGEIIKIKGSTLERGVYSYFEKDFSKSVFMTPLGEFGNTFLIELTRGCPAGCRFCISRTLYNPLRFAEKDLVISMMKEHMDAEKFGFMGASVSFHPHLKEFMETALASGKKFSISSLRAERIDMEFLRLLKAGGSQTITIAPEAGEDEMRERLNKGITKEHIEKAVNLSLMADIDAIKLYFMIGLPFEKQEDIDAIINMGKLIRHTEKLTKKYFKKISFNITPFVPKPLTPFQWAAFESLPSIKSKLNYLRKGLTALGINVYYDTPKWAYMEAVLSRGDRRARNILIKNIPSNKANLDFYASRIRSDEEIFPWDFINIGIPKEKLLQEWKKIRDSQY